jgi:hypothetical protein
MDNRGRRNQNVGLTMPQVKEKYFPQWDSSMLGGRRISNIDEGSLTHLLEPPKDTKIVKRNSKK